MFTLICLYFLLRQRFAVFYLLRFVYYNAENPDYYLNFVYHYFGSFAKIFFIKEA